MKIIEENVTLILEKEDYPEHTKRFIAVMLRMLAKGVDNPTFQLNAIVMLGCGRNCYDLVANKSNKSSDKFIDILKELTDPLLKELMNNMGTEMSNGSIDDFLNRGER